MQRWPAGYGREIRAELDSTNAEALRRAAAGAAGPLWILAHAQTAARGRRGRAWSTQPGNFAASLLMHPPGPPAQAALRSFVAALGLFDALVQATGQAELLALKWPNDVLLGGGKLAGILLETGGQLGGAPALAIGFGVNLAAAPAAEGLEPGAVPPVSLRAATDAAIAPEDFLDRLAPAVAHWETRLRAEGFAPLRAAWLARAARLGEPVTARLPDRSITGRFETIDAAGALVLATPRGLVALPAAELHFAAGDPPGPPEVPPGPPEAPPGQPPEGPPGAPETPPDLPPEIPPGEPSDPALPPELPPEAPDETPPGAPLEEPFDPPPEGPPGAPPELPPQAPPEFSPGTPRTAREALDAARH